MVPARVIEKHIASIRSFLLGRVGLNRVGPPLIGLSRGRKHREPSNAQRLRFESESFSGLMNK